MPKIEDISKEDEALYGVRTPAQVEASGQILDRTIADIRLFDDIYRIRIHPSRLIKAHITQWVREYDNAQKYRIPKELDDRHPCWADLEDEYEYIVKGFTDGGKHN